MKFVLLTLVLCAQLRAQDIQTFYNVFRNAEKDFRLPALELDYRDNFAAMPAPADLDRQQRTIDSLTRAFVSCDTGRLTREDRALYRTIRFELGLHRERIRLSRQWQKEHMTGGGGLYALPNGKEWYAYYVRRFTGLELTPQDVFSIGEQEVAIAQREIAAVKKELGFLSDSLFYRYLAQPSQYFTSKDSVLHHFNRVDSLVRTNLHRYFSVPSPPRVEAMEWQGAGAQTPPGIYLGRRNNAYGVDVFQYNFYNGVFSKRCLDWLYLHEAIPGHHLQSLYFREEEPFYFGTSEGWACYVEKLGSGLGLYSDLFRKLGEHEWNLVRSARLVMEAGIHYFGWDREKALSYWMQNIQGQDQIAGREINRIAVWPGQAVCYKAGALAISRIVDDLVRSGSSITAAHAFVLAHGHLPLYALL